MTKQNPTYRTIPIMETFFSDTLTPIDVVQQLGHQVSYLLESKDDESAWGRYSFVGFNPFASISKEKDFFVFKNISGELLQTTTDIKSSIEQALDYLNVAPLENHDIPFYGGAVGCAGYDAVSDFDGIKVKEKNSLGLPTYYFVFCRSHIIFDHKEKSLSVIELVDFEEQDLQRDKDNKVQRAYQSIKSHVEKFKKEDKKQNIFQMKTKLTEDDFQNVTSNYSKENFMKDVETIKEYIRAGDIFQAVLSQRFEVPLNISALDVYRVLRTINPSPYLFYLNIDGAEIVGSSPERLVNVFDKKIEIHPIAGTRKRGATKNEDDQFAEELYQDEKERAEHMMLVDLARNDVGRVAKYGSVKVPVLMELGRFSQVMHLVSKVTGELDQSYHPMDAFISSFPAGTVSGAPKIRAMEIIEELEPTARGLYAGSVGYVGYDQTIDACIAIRTIIVKDKKAYVQAGAGIVADSVPELEWKETRNKARAMIKAIHLATSYFNESEDVQYV